MVKPECSYARFDKEWKDMTGQRVWAVQGKRSKACSHLFLSPSMVFEDEDTAYPPGMDGSERGLEGDRGRWEEGEEKGRHVTLI